ncbi:MAG: AMIN domain-containing protein, partial [Elusimicrobia bacterium]|nr:AMIN domain-containing protein [Elusimicrobiota bacterium]
SPPAEPAPRPKRRRPAAAQPAPAAAPEPATPAIPGVGRLLKVTARRDSVLLTLSEAAKPKVSYSPTPPRLLLDFSDAKSKLPPRDIAGSRPNIPLIRVRESDADGRVLWVEIQLSKTATNRIDHEGASLRVRFDFGRP